MTTEKIRHEFHWKRPRFTTYRAADPRPLSVRLNRYPGIVIGISVKVGHRALGLTWGAPGKQIAGCPDCAKGVHPGPHRTVAERENAIAVHAEAMRVVRTAEQRNVR